MREFKRGSPRRFVRLFQPRFAPLVERGIKRQTVRCTPKRMPAAGDMQSNRTWTGVPYRSKQRVLCESVIYRVAQVMIDPCGVRLDGSPVDPDRFAQAAGFADFPDLLAWFNSTHALPFEGTLRAVMPPTTQNYKTTMSEENQNVTTKPAGKALTASSGSALKVSACKDKGRVISVDKKGKKYHVVIDGLLAMRMGIRPGEWWEASHFFGDDQSKDGLAVEIQRPVKQWWHKHEGGGEMRVSFDVLLFRG